MNERNELITVARFSTLLEMDVARALLDSEGIDCFAPEEHLVAASGGLYGTAVGWLRLQVRAEDADNAQALLEALPASNHEASSGKDER